MIQADGSGLRQLTSGAFDLYPTWSPDGSRIAFLRFLPGPEVPIDGDNTPMPSADATQTAEAYIPAEIMLIDVDGSNKRTLTTLSGYGDPPQWLWDGTLIAYTDGKPSEYRVTVINVELGTTLTPLVSPRTSRRTTLPSWIPHTTFLSLVQIDPDGSQAQIVRVYPDGSEAQPVTEFYGWHAWSLEGNHLAVLVEGVTIDGTPTGTSNLYLVAGDGSGERSIFNDATLGPWLAWRP